METVKEKRKKFEFPHTYVIIGIILVFVTVLTYIIPAGQYQRVEDADGQMVVLSDSFEFIEQTPVGPGGMVMAIVEGMVQSADIIFSYSLLTGWCTCSLKQGHSLEVWER